MAKKDDKKLLETARERFKRCVDADQENRRKAVDDLKFLHIPGEQWDEVIKAERGTRPNYEFNKTRIVVKRIVNQIRANRPMGRVVAVEDNDKDTAEIIEGLCRNIWSVSDGDCAVDTAAEYSVGAGMGAWRVATKYSTDEAWDQDIVIEPIRNPLALWCDPAARDPVKRDAEYWFLESKMTKAAYEAKYGKVPAIEWEASEFGDEEDWEDDDSVRICEFWYKKPVTKTLALLPDGQTVEASEAPEGVMPTRTRQVQTNQICMAIIAGDKVLEGPVDWAGTKFPFVVVYGEHVYIDGKNHWFGLTRFAKDAQRSYNYSRTLAVEAVALAPQAKYWATPTQAQGHTEMWARAHKENLPFQLFNPDPQNPGAPQRMGGADIPSALINETQWASEDIKGVTGVFDPSLSAKTNATSGVAKRAEIEQGELVCFNYPDNVARGVLRTYEILTDLIPKVYDTERSLRILGNDGAEKYVKVNTIDPQTGKTLNDLTRGKFDTQVKVGPNLGTRRQEAAELYMGLAQAYPPMMAAAGDLIVKTFDDPYSDDMAERLLLMAPPQIQSHVSQKEQSGGKPLDPRAQAAMMQAEQMMQQVQQMGQMVEQAANEAEGLKAEAEAAKVQLDGQQAKLEADYQKMLADIAKREAQLILKDASLTAQATQQGVSEESKKVEGERQDLGSQLTEAVAAMQAQVAEFMAQAAQTITQIQATAQPQVVVANQPRRKQIVMVGPGGKQYQATVEEQ